MLSTLTRLLRLTWYKVIGTLLILALPFVASWLSEQTATIVTQARYQSMSSQQMAQDLEQGRQAMEDMQPHLDNLIATTPSVEKAYNAAVIVQWVVSIVAAYFIAAILVEMPKRRQDHHAENKPQISQMTQIEDL